MPYKDYLAADTELRVHFSEVESRASGLSVGRMEIWPPRRTRGREVLGLIQDSGFDLVIVRAGAEDVELAATLDSPALISWQADTLLYFETSTTSLATGHASARLARLTQNDESAVDVLIGRIFADYRNHYSSNPILREINVVAAYRDWARTALGSTKNAVFAALTPNASASGLCVTDVEEESYDEILLAGIVPEERGHGAYQDMVRLIALQAQDAGKGSLVISTQAANVGVMRAWCRLGFLPTIALNTFHVMRRGIYQHWASDHMEKAGP